MRVVFNVLFSLVILEAQTGKSAFNSYAVFLDRVQMPGECSIADPEHFRNRAYVFRGRKFGQRPLVLHDGKAVELNERRRPEWETELVRQSVVSVGGESAVMLRFVANHVGGTGSRKMVLIGRCNDRQLTVLFEAESEGLGDSALTADDVLVVKRALWSRSDAHCCPSGEAEERYRWDRNAHGFVRISAR